MYGNDAAGRASYGYDAVGRVLSIVYANATGDVQTAFAYGYDAVGNRQYKKFLDGSQESYRYDSLNRLTTADYPGGRHAEYGYDAVGNRLSLVDTGRGAATQWATSATASDSWNAPRNATGAPDSYAWASASTSAWLETTFPGGRANAIRVHETGGAPFVMRIDLTDDQGTAHTVYSGGDQTANGGWLVVPVELTSYNVVKVKLSVSQGGGASGGYIAVDAVGLDVQPADTYQYNEFNQLTQVTGSDGSSTTFGYDGNGNQVRKTDATGVTQYVYNEDNRLVGIALPNGVSNAFEYDANGLRTKKTDSGGTTRYLLDGLSVVAQYDTSGTRQYWYTQSLARIDEVLSVVNLGGKQWYQADALGSVYGLTSASGVLIGSQNYDVFGAPTPAPSGPAGQPFGFTGREHELDSGLVYARARYLNPAVGAWTRPDPLTASAMKNGSLAAEPWLRVVGEGLPLADNGPRYAYVQPTLGTDPAGLAVIYLGGTGDVGFRGGAHVSIGGVFGFGGPRGFSSGVAATLGYVVSLLKSPLMASVGAELGVYWGLNPDDACGYGGWFATLGGSFGAEVSVGFSLVWGVSENAIAVLDSAIRGHDPVAARMAEALVSAAPVGISFELSYSLVPGLSVAATVTETWVYPYYNCSCGSTL